MWKSSHAALKVRCIRRSDMPRYTLCPYYIDENKKTISCEDIIRRFATYRSKNKWMNKYCDKEWKGCPYAQALDVMYQRIDQGADEPTARLCLQVQSLKAENKKLIALLGRYDVRIDVKDAEIRQLRIRITQEREKRQAAERSLKEWMNEKSKQEDAAGSERLLAKTEPSALHEDA